MAATRTPVAATTRPLGEPLPLEWADYLTIMGHHMSSAGTGQRADFRAGVLDIWTAGALDPHWSGLANPSFDIEEGGSEVEQAYGEYISLWGDRFWSARFGQTVPFAVLFNQGGPRMSLSDPVVLSTPVSMGTGWTPESLLRGVEVGFVSLGRWNAYAGAAEPASEGADGDDHIDLFASAQYLHGDDVALTGYGYWGSGRADNTEPWQDFQRYGVFGSLYQRMAKWTVGYLAGSDDVAQGSDLDSSGYFALSERLLSDRWAAYARYDHFRRDRVTQGSQTIEGPTVGVSWWAETQVRLTAEGQVLNISDEPDERILRAEFMWVF